MATISHAIRIRAPRARVYQALSTRDGLQGWNTPDLEGDVAQGREFTLRYGDGVSFRWKVSKLDSGSAVSWECTAGPGAAAGSTLWGILLGRLRTYAETSQPQDALA